MSENVNKRLTLRSQSLLTLLQSQAGSPAHLFVIPPRVTLATLSPKSAMSLHGLVPGNLSRGKEGVKEGQTQKS